MNIARFTHYVLMLSIVLLSAGILFDLLLWSGMVDSLHTESMLLKMLGLGTLLLPYIVVGTLLPFVRNHLAALLLLTVTLVILMSSSISLALKLPQLFEPNVGISAYLTWVFQFGLSLGVALFFGIVSYLRLKHRAMADETMPIDEI